MKTIVAIITTVIGLGFVTAARAGNSPALEQPAKSVYDHYLKIQAQLAKDSMQDVREQAGAIVKAAKSDSGKVLPAKVGDEAATLAGAKDLKAARAAFNPLSNSLIKYLADHHAKGAYVQVYCPMAKASWLQADKNVKNPYLGKAMSMCGEIQE